MIGLVFDCVFSITRSLALFLLYILSFMAMIFSATFAEGLPAFTELSLEKAIEIALKENKEIQSSEYGVISSKYELSASYGNLFPQLNLEGKITKINDPITLDVGSIRTAMIGADTNVFRSATNSNVATVAGFSRALEQAIPPFKMEIQDDHYYNLSATLSQTLFTGGKITANINAKKEDLSISEAQDYGTKDKVISEVVINYFKVQLLKELVKIRAEVVNGLREHQAHALKLLKAGLLSKANKMRADVALAEAIREEYKTQQDLELSYILLNNSLGLIVPSPSTTSPTISPTTLLTTPLFITEEKISLEEYLQKAITENYNLQTLGHKQNQLGEKSDAIAASFYPTFAAFAKYELYRKDLTLFEPDWAIGVVMKMNIFEGGANLHNLQAVAAQKKMLATYHENVTSLVKTEIQKYYHDLKTAREQIKSLESSSLLAKENLRLNKLSFAEGVATSLEVIDAELALSKVKTEQSKAMFDYDSALVNLFRSTGNAKRILQSALSAVSAVSAVKEKK
ncbi:MAG: TolC family protein [Oligoflexia bacterium]|nr:TolC family protein [Oligoflexia bacterium]